MVVLEEFATIDLQNDFDVQVELLIHVQQDVEDVPGVRDVNFLLFNKHNLLGEAADVEVHF